MNELTPIRIGITTGDPSGVGPEVSVKALAALPPQERKAFTLIGHRDALARADRQFGCGLGLAQTDTVAVEHVETTDFDAVRDGRVTAAGGEAAYSYVLRAVDLAGRGDIDVIVTAPLNKEAMHAAGHRFDGHTGLLQHLTGAKSSFMLLASDVLTTIHVSTHVSLAEAIARMKTPRIVETIRVGGEHLRAMGVSAPRIAVSGLNPHCGEGGLFGSEDAEQIVPAVEQMRAEGWNVSGPIPADTVFLRAVRGEFDLVVAQYHDQGHMPVKLLAFDQTVNVSLGLPVMRTSVDHGTAFDIAWKGVADHTNMLAAIAYAQRYARARAKRKTDKAADGAADGAASCASA